MISKGIRPEDVLPENENYALVDGVKIRKGSIAAVMQNCKILSSPTASQEEKNRAKETIIELAPALVLLGVHEHMVWKNAEVQKIMEDAAKSRT